MQRKGRCLISLITVMASSCALPTGAYGPQPLAVYDSYRSYRQSADYVAPPLPSEAGTPLEYLLDLEKIEGNVLVYRSQEEFECIYVDCFENPPSSIVKLLALPHLYCLGISVSLPQLIHYLRSFLGPEDRAEVLTYWAGSGGMEPDDPLCLPFDLKHYVSEKADEQTLWELESELPRSQTLRVSEFHLDDEVPVLERIVSRSQLSIFHGSSKRADPPILEQKVHAPIVIFQQG